MAARCYFEAGIVVAVNVVLILKSYRSCNLVSC